MRSGGEIKKKPTDSKSFNQPKKGKNQKGKGSYSSKPSKQDKDPVWWSFTKTQSDFTSAARSLSDTLVRVYGQVSISKFEKMLGEISTLTPEQKKLIALSQPLIDLYKKYKKAKEDRDAQRQSFRATKDVVAIEATLGSVEDLLTSGGAFAALSLSSSEEDDEE